MKDVGDSYLEGTVLVSTCTLMATERSQRDRKWKHQADIGPNEGTTSGSSLWKKNSIPFDNNEDEVVTFELGEMLLMLLAAGKNNSLTNSEDNWDSFHDKLDDFCDLDLQQLCVACELVFRASDSSCPLSQCLCFSLRQAYRLQVLL